MPAVPPPDANSPDAGSPGAEDVTQLLQALAGGDERAVDRLLPLVYGDLRKRAHHQLRRHRPGDTLNTTSLVHEAYLKLADQTQLDWQNRAHFLAIAAKAMRYIIIDYARRQGAQKRGGDAEVLSLDEAAIPVQARAAHLLDLDAALDDLAERDARMAQVVEYRFFGGLTINETAQALDVSPRTVKRDWRLARAVLARRLQA